VLLSRLAVTAWGQRGRLRGGDDFESALLRGAGRVVLFVIRHPLITGTLAGAVWVAVRFGPLALAVAVVWLVGLVVLVRMLWRPGFDWLAARVRRRWRIWTIYDPLWRPTMIFTGLARHLDGVEHVPYRRKVRCTRWADYVVVTLIEGQRPFAFAQVAEHLAHSFRARSCHVQPARDRQGHPVPGHVLLILRRRDPLVNVVAPIDPAGLDELIDTTPPAGDTQPAGDATAGVWA